MINVFFANESDFPLIVDIIIGYEKVCICLYNVCFGSINGDSSVAIMW